MRALQICLLIFFARHSSGSGRNGCDHACLNSPSDQHRDRYNRQPNIIYIMSDDMGWNDVGFKNPKVKTPNIDAFKKKGIELTQSYMQPVCSASRASFVTGKYPSNNAVQLLVILEESLSCLPIEQKTIFEYMKEEGYVTKFVGKWHLGYCNTTCRPGSRGVDEFRGIYTGSAHYFNWTEYGVLQRRINNRPTTENIGTHMTTQDARDAREMILAHKDNPKPLFMWVSPTAPHDPLQVTDAMFNVHHEFLNATVNKTKSRRTYLGLVSAFDDLLGDTLAAIKEAGLDKNTVVIFSSDNGGASQSSANAGYQYYANNYPLRNGKLTFMDGGVRVPTVYYDPRLKSSTRGTERDFLIHVTDWLPTFVHLAKQGRRSSNFKIEGLDGVSQLANLGSNYNCPEQRKYNRREEMLVGLTDNKIKYRNPPKCATEDAAFRWRDYKLIHGYQYYIVDPDTLDTEWSKPEESPELPEITGDNCHRMVNGERVVRCLFNVIDDPRETKNLYDEHPALVARLLRKIQKAKWESVKPIYRPDIGKTNYTVKQWGNYLVPQENYCDPLVDSPLIGADPSCY